MADHKLMLFALNASEALGRRIADSLDVSLSDHEERPFDDGEHKARPLVDVAGCDVFVIHTLFGEAGGPSPNDKLCRLLFFLGAVRDAGASRVTAVVPYLCYARKDRRTKPHDPITTRYVAALFEAVGVDAVITVDVHNAAAFDNAYRCRTVPLEATALFVEHFVPLAEAGQVTVVSPDAGGMKRAERFRQALADATGRAVAGAFMEKRRSEGVISGEEAVAGDVRNRIAIIYDDLIATGATQVRAARACAAAGARRVYAAATHGLFVGGSPELLNEPSLHHVVTTNTISPPPPVTDASDRVAVVDAAPLLAEAIRQLHSRL